MMFMQLGVKQNEKKYSLGDKSIMIDGFNYYYIRRVTLSVMMKSKRIIIVLA